MLSLWIELQAEDIMAFAGTLVLPSYMSHLRLAPFSFADQPTNRNGRETLTVTYVGPGRVEEVQLDPDRHASNLISASCELIDPTRFCIPDGDDAVWRWLQVDRPPSDEAIDNSTSLNDASHVDSGLDSDAPVWRMRVHFTPNREISGPRVEPFDPRDAYVSVSREHIFIGTEVLTAYVEAAIQDLGITEPIEPIRLESPSGGVELRCGRIGGELLFDSPVTIGNLIRFAGLQTVLDQVSGSCQLNDGGNAFDSPGEMTARGIVIPIFA